MSSESTDAELPFELSRALEEFRWADLDRARRAAMSSDAQIHHRMLLYDDGPVWIWREYKKKFFGGTQFDYWRIGVNLDSRPGFSSSATAAVLLYVDGHVTFEPDSPQPSELRAVLEAVQRAAH